MAAIPNYVVTTGDFIAEWMEDTGVNAAELARRLGTTPKHVSEVLAGKAPVSAQLALSLERVTSVPARIWNMYEAGYREDLARMQSVADLESQYEEAKRFPLAYLRKFGFIKAEARDRAGTVREVLGLLGVASFDAWKATWSHGSVAYRRSAVGRDDVAALAVWLTIAERQATADPPPPFNRTELEKLVPELRNRTVDDPLTAIERAIAGLREAGVVLCFVPGVPGLGIHGATRWINGNPLIQLSLLWKSDDQLWFTLFHEIGHVLLHGDKRLYVNGEHNEAELEADRYASDLLIPPEFISRLPLNRNIASVQELASELGIAPSIVLGRAQRETRDYGWGHSLKRKFEFVAD
ncbi:ImmA/IrrE family metallo-endopeptidase [Leifsonia sp. fls2-241-R2A-40a]|uniref:ImmA/IrrE family metallo-endopeptidase n=1 Tax=Leifsonia sp. fls2-241-R2A-40a TaxID=3040290 RepID=UPI002550DD1C|nr:ImmA/IrrE family metallo-endopeptidase [Leifsonia sp. fls2-241-R2A-40a]